jgi:hypothetical protein
LLEKSCHPDFPFEFIVTACAASTVAPAYFTSLEITQAPMRMTPYQLASDANTPTNHTVNSSLGPAAGTSVRVRALPTVWTSPRIRAVCIGVARNPAKAGDTVPISPSQVMSASKALTPTWEKRLSRIDFESFIPFHRYQMFRTEIIPIANSY